MVAFSREVIVFCNKVNYFVTFSLTFPSSLLKLFVVTVTPGTRDNKKGRKGTNLINTEIKCVPALPESSGRSVKPLCFLTA